MRLSSGNFRLTARKRGRRGKGKVATATQLSFRTLLQRHELLAEAMPASNTTGQPFRNLSVASDTVFRVVDPAQCTPARALSPARSFAQGSYGRRSVFERLGPPDLPPMRPVVDPVAYLPPVSARTRETLAKQD